MFCRNCGHEIEGVERFCAQCGAALEGVPAGKTNSPLWWAKVAGVLGAVAIVAVVLAALVGGGNAGAPAVGWQTYSNEEYRFRFHYPQDWCQFSLPPAVVCVGESSWSTFRHNANLVLEPTTLTLDQYVSATRRQLENFGYLIISDDYLTINGRRAYEIVSEKEWLPGTTKQKQVCFVANGKAYILTCAASVGTYSSYDNIFDRIVRSFVIW